MQDAGRLPMYCHYDPRGAERRLGEMIKLQKETVGLAKGTRGTLRGRDASGVTITAPPENDPFHGAATLAEAGIDKKLEDLREKLGGSSVPSRNGRISSEDAPGRDRGREGAQWYE